MSQVQTQGQHQPDNHDQSDVQDQPQIGDQLQALIAAVPESRVIQIETSCERDAQGIIHSGPTAAIYDDDDDDDDDNDADDTDALLHWSPTQCSPTPLLGICRESRSIAMKHYKYSSFLDRPLFYNPDLDTLWVRGNSLFQCVSTEPPSETTLEVLFWQRRYTVALDFAGIKAHHEIVPPQGDIPQDISLCLLYAVSKTEVENIYIVYSSGDCRDKVEQEVKYLVEQMKFCAGDLNLGQFIQDGLKEMNERDGTNLAEWKMPTVEAILDTRLLNPIETFHNFPNLPLELRRAI
ncbi:hypothetical protein BOTCAL_0492g00110 [Botryotinia calthae]|uniref:2EXR domain-containing protein n=1 Tax=Botryotinia calthae TaxID=38488 RepID=A0A4Y8CLP2_9HELO|nr:hypothetical protein BOTCAL_0492g00110 [Botryotinia calthae]